MIIFTGGKTAGHIYPLIEIIKYVTNDKVLYIGLNNSLEEEICNKNNIPFYGINLVKKSDYFKAYNKIKKMNFKLVVSSGGFVSFPSLLAAKMNGKKYILLEENVVFGITNNIFKNGAYKVCLGLPMKKMKKNYIYTFNPTVERKVEYKKYQKYKYRILVLGGSLGSKVMCDIADKIAVIKKENEEIIVVSKNHSPKSTGIIHYNYVDDLPSLISSADLVISRAGGGTISEILGLNKKLIIVPSKSTKRNHQVKNALYLEKIGVANVIMEDEFSINKYLKIKNNKFIKHTDIVLKDSGKRIYDVIKEALL